MIRQLHIACAAKRTSGEGHSPAKVVPGDKRFSEASQRNRRLPIAGEERGNPDCRVTALSGLVRQA